MAAPEVNPMSRWHVPEDFEPSPRARPAHAEGSFTRIIEQQTAKVPSSVFLTVALASMAASAALQLSGRVNASRFVGMWAPALLTMGVYNKLVKSLGTA